MKKYSLLPLIIATVVFAQEKAGELVGQPGSKLKNYEAAAALLEKTTDPAQVREKSIQILKDYFGYTEVVFASSRAAKCERENSTAKFIATHLKDILPVSKKDGYYVGVNHEWVSANAEGQKFRLIPVMTERKYRIVFDCDVDGINFDAKVEDKKADKIDPLTKRDDIRVEIMTLTVGGKRFLVDTGTLKNFSSLMMNYSGLYNRVDFDLDKEMTVKCPNCSKDLRVSDGQGKEVPVETKSDPAKKDGNLPAGQAK